MSKKIECSRCGKPFYRSLGPECPICAMTAHSPAIIFGIADLLAKSEPEPETQD